MTLHLGDCLDWLPKIPDHSVDAVISDPPYPCIDRPYGRMTEVEWHEMMREVIKQTRRILKPKGSAVFILQPNSRKMGSMRPWLFEFQAWCCREWNIVQDAYWWNTTALPKCGQVRSRVLPRPSVKPCVWLGEPDCFRDIDQVLRELSPTTKRAVPDQEEDSRSPSGWRGDVKPKFHRRSQMYRAAQERGGSTPFNVLPIPNASSTNSAGSHGHGAGTPFDLADWWTRYISPPDGVVADWFMGSGTMGLAALKRGRPFIGIEREPEYHAIASKRIRAIQAESPLFA